SVRLAVAEDVGDIKTSIARIEATCKPCREEIIHLAEIVDGTNGEGLKVQVAKLKQNWKVVLSIVGFGATLISALTAIIMSHLL
ncbi:unnamed protein product, partial [marine sediment metagenome]